MPVPAKRRSSQRLRQGRAHRALKAMRLVKCSKCGKMTKPHQVCVFCGYYKGREIIKPKVRTKKAPKK